MNVCEPASRRFERAELDHRLLPSLFHNAACRPLLRVDGHRGPCAKGQEAELCVSASSHDERQPHERCRPIPLVRICCGSAGSRGEGELDIARVADAFKRISAWRSVGPEVFADAMDVLDAPEVGRRCGQSLNAWIAA